MRKKPVLNDLNFEMLKGQILGISVSLAKVSLLY